MLAWNPEKIKHRKGTVNRGFFLGHEYGGVFDQFFSIRNGAEGWKIPYLTIKEG